MLEDDELAELLADEDRVREALSAAVDGQQVPPVRTDLVQIVERGRRRARMQVLAASMGAVVLIAAVALGATVLGRHGGSDKVQTAAGQPPLPVTTQAPTTPTTVLSGLCVFPDAFTVPGDDKALPPSAVQDQIFRTEVQTMMLDAHVQVINAIDPTLQQKGMGDLYAVQVVGDSSYHNSTVTLQQVAFTGTADEAAMLDVKRYQFPAKNCSGKAEQVALGDGTVANQYIGSTDSGEYYVRVQLYTAQGQRLDLTELTDPIGREGAQPTTDVPTSPTPTGATGSGTTGSGTTDSGTAGFGGASSSPDTTYRAASPLDASQLLAVAMRIGQITK